MVGGQCFTCPLHLIVGVYHCLFHVIDCKVDSSESTPQVKISENTFRGYATNMMDIVNRIAKSRIEMLCIWRPRHRKVNFSAYSHACAIVAFPGIFLQCVAQAKSNGNEVKFTQAEIFDAAVFMVFVIEKVAKELLVMSIGTVRRKFAAVLRQTCDRFMTIWTSMVELQQAQQFGRQIVLCNIQSVDSVTV